MVGVSVKRMIMLVLIMSAVLFQCVSGANFTVGGPAAGGWNTLSSSNLTASSSSTPFFLVFHNTPELDVIEVSKSDFAECRTSSPITTYNTGEAVIPLSQPGSRYFVSGRSNQCTLGLKLRVQVLNHSSSHSNATGSSNNSNQLDLHMHAVYEESPNLHMHHDQPGPYSSDGHRNHSGLLRSLRFLVLVICELCVWFNTGDYWLQFFLGLILVIWYILEWFWDNVEKIKETYGSGFKKDDLDMGHDYKDPSSLPPLVRNIIRMLILGLVIVILLRSLRPMIIIWLCALAFLCHFGEGRDPSVEDDADDAE